MLANLQIIFFSLFLWRIASKWNLRNLVPLLYGNFLEGTLILKMDKGLFLIERDGVPWLFVDWCASLFARRLNKSIVMLCVPCYYDAAYHLCILCEHLIISRTVFLLHVTTWFCIVESLAGWSTKFMWVRTFFFAEINECSLRRAGLPWTTIRRNTGTVALQFISQECTRALHKERSEVSFGSIRLTERVICHCATFLPPGRFLKGLHEAHLVWELDRSW